MKRWTLCWLTGGRFGHRWSKWQTMWNGEYRACVCCWRSQILALCTCQVCSRIRARQRAEGIVAWVIMGSVALGMLLLALLERR